MEAEPGKGNGKRASLRPLFPTGVLTKWSWTGVGNHSDGESRIPQVLDIRLEVLPRVVRGKVLLSQKAGECG